MDWDEAQLRVSSIFMTMRIIVVAVVVGVAASE